jgi:hypothetical protein
MTMEAFEQTAQAILVRAAVIGREGIDRVS